MAKTVKAQKRVMFVWLPNFAMIYARLKRPPLADQREPLVLLEKHGNIRRIAALDEPAIRAGLYLHQPLADALAMYPKLVCADADPEAAAEALTALAFWAQRYSPATAPAPPCGLWLDITGCAHLWGGEAALADDLIASLEERGIQARAAIAPTFGAAYALAHHATRSMIAPSHLMDPPPPRPSPTASALRMRSHQSRKLALASLPGEGEDEGGSINIAALLSLLPVERLRIGEETAILLRKLGLFTIGDVEKLPRAGLSRRFPGLLPQLDKAMGRVAEAIEFLRPPTSWIERLRFAEPVSSPEDLERATVMLLGRLCARLQAERKGGQRFEVMFFRCDGGVQSQAVSTALPVRDAARIFRLFREKLELIDPGFGIDGAMLAATHVEPLETRQTALLRKVQSEACAEELAALIDALENRLGEGRVYRLAPCESYIPERAVKRQAPLDQSSWPGFTRPSKEKRQTLDGRTEGGHDKDVWPDMAGRPVRLFASPQPIDVTAAIPDAPPVMFRWRKVLHRIVRADGPERISPEWWRKGAGADEDSHVRDYYRVQSSHGMRFWVFREGLYGSRRLPRWYLHGVFA